MNLQQLYINGRKNARYNKILKLFISFLILFILEINMVVTISLKKLDNSSLSTDLESLKKILVEGKQEHILELLNSNNTEGVNKLITQLSNLEHSCTGGGLLGYINRARKLLKDSKEGVNPREGCFPEVPETKNLKIGTKEFLEYENLGFSVMRNTAFVLVAGGLGERLSFEGIKISIELSIASNITFFGLYSSYIKEYEKKILEVFGEEVVIPLIIMTSDDTDTLTREFLEENDNFGLKDDQIFIVKQLKVPALSDSEARIALDPEDKYSIITKPHGHGDIHTLLKESGFLSELNKKGVKYLVFIQDTNALVFNSILAVLGVTSKESFVMNTLTIPRIPCEAVGALCKLRYPDGSKITINTEYNQLDPLLKSCGLGSDFPDKDTGYSPYPGNSNVLFISLKDYLETLESTGGIVPEFVNPKYVDSTKTAFKSPTRLECMMQDIPLLFKPNSKIGCVQMERWATFSACKNSLTEGRAKHKAGLSIDTASITENDYYAANSQILRLASLSKNVTCRIEESDKDPVTGQEVKNSDIKTELISGIPVRTGAMIVLHPSFSTRFVDVLNRIKAGPIIILANSYVHIEGNVTIEGKFFVSGSVRLIAKNNSKIVIKNLIVNNKGSKRYQITDEEMCTATSNQKIRGYGIKHEEIREIFVESGELVVDDE